MKKIILILIVILFSTSVLAQNFDIKVLNYDPETGNVRLQIKNSASTDFTDVKIIIDHIAEKASISIIKADSLFIKFFTIPPGQHEITITTEQGISETKQIYFPQTEEQLREDIKSRLEKERENKSATTPLKPKKISYIYILLALITILIIYWLYKKFNPPNELQK